MPTGQLDSELGVTFVGSMADRRSERWFPGQAFTAALERNGLRTTSLRPTVKQIPTLRMRARGSFGWRGVLVSPRFLVDLVRSSPRFVVCREYGLETLLTLVAARLSGRRGLVFQEHVGRAGASLSFLDVRYRRLIGWLATGFIANTPAAKDEIVGLLRVDPSRVFQVTTMVPPARAELCSDPIDIGSPRARPLFLSLGQLIVLKNIEAILCAAALLQGEGLDFEVWVAGGGSDEGRLRRLAGELELDRIVRFIGPIPYQSVGFVYDACDVFVQPSHLDYLSMAVLEAARFGKAVICSERVGSAGVFALDGINALIFDPGEPSQLADRMRRFIVDPGLAAEMGARSAGMMEDKTLDSAALGLIEVLKQVSAEG